MNYKGKNFLDLNNNDNIPIWLTYLKKDTWLKHIRHSNSLYTCVIRVITNHALISEYYLRFFAKNHLLVYMKTIQLNQEIIYYMSVNSIENIEILKETH